MHTSHGYSLTLLNLKVQSSFPCNHHLNLLWPSRTMKVCFCIQTKWSAEEKKIQMKYCWIMQSILLSFFVNKWTPSLLHVPIHFFSSDWKRRPCLSKYLDKVSVCLCVPVLWWSLQFLVRVFTFLSLNLWCIWVFQIF